MVCLGFWDLSPILVVVGSVNGRVEGGGVRNLHSTNQIIAASSDLDRRVL